MGEHLIAEPISTFEYSPPPLRRQVPVEMKYAKLFFYDRYLHFKMKGLFNEVLCGDTYSDEELKDGTAKWEHISRNMEVSVLRRHILGVELHYVENVNVYNVALILAATAVEFNLFYRKYQAAVEMRDVFLRYILIYSND